MLLAVLYNQTLEKHVPLDIHVDKQTPFYPYNGIPLSYKKEHTIITQNTKEDSQKYYLSEGSQT